MKYCCDCGAKLTGEPLCANCGAKPPAATPSTLVSREDPGASTPNPPAGSPRRRGRAWLVGGAMALGGMSVTAIVAINSDVQNQSVATAGAPAESPSLAPNDASPESATEAPTRAASPTPEPESLAALPQQALNLTASEARAQLKTHRQSDRSTLDSLLYSWAPQVSSKCEGLDNVDLRPGWFPDGRADTSNLTAQQILGFHLSLADRDGALLITDRDVGDRMVYSGCSGKTMWMALIPRSFRSAAAANRWCDRNGYPVGECAARYIVDEGESGAKVKWRT